jgi:hypothetical protein
MNAAQDTTVPEVARWTDILTRIAQEPLELRPTFPAIAARHEAWWHQAVPDRPLFMANATTDPDRPITRKVELLDQPEEWLAASETDVRLLHRVGDTLPALRVDFGPIVLAGLFGGEREVAANTVWTHECIKDDWSNAPDWTTIKDESLWERVQHLNQLAARRAVGRWMVCTQDVGNSADVLLSLRGALGLCTDVITKDDAVRQASLAMQPTWHKVHAARYDSVLEQGAGLIHWLGLWSNRPYDVTGCDFNALIGPETFANLFVPAIAQQASAAGRSVFHLDGPDATRHIDLLLDMPELQAIQFSPGAGTPSALAWIDMFQKIQDRGRSVMVICPASEVLSLCDHLKPESLAIQVTEMLDPAELDALYARFCQKYSCGEA